MFCKEMIMVALNFSELNLLYLIIFYAVSFSLNLNLGIILTFWNCFVICVMFFLMFTT
jgi:hypothetical protein